MATVREGVMKREIADPAYKGEAVYPDVSAYVPAEDYVVKVLDRHIEVAKHNLKGAPIIVAGGYGVGRISIFCSSLPRNSTERSELPAQLSMPAGSTMTARSDRRV